MVFAIADFPVPAAPCKRRVRGLVESRAQSRILERRETRVSGKHVFNANGPALFAQCKASIILECMNFIVLLV
jgi:hypothetical protein